jgi:hypothetical protein
MLIALFLLSVPPVSSSAGPTTQEFASALAEHKGGPVKATDLRHLSCKGFGPDEPTEADCNWRQRVGSTWKRYSTYVAVDGRGWHLIDEPFCSDCRGRPKGASTELVMTTAAHGDECLVTLDGQTFVTLRLESDALTSRLRQLGRRKVVLQAPSDTPYRCIGSAIIILQRANANFRVPRLPSS